MISIYSHSYAKTIHRQNELISSICEYKYAYTFIFHLWNFRSNLASVLSENKFNGLPHQQLHYHKAAMQCKSVNLVQLPFCQSLFRISQDQNSKLFYSSSQHIEKTVSVSPAAHIILL